MAFDYRTATEDEILAHARSLPGTRLGDLPRARFSDAEGSRTRAEAGHAVEAFFGIPRNSLAAPDFPMAGIELKVLPLRGLRRGLAVKERTVVSMIDYGTLVEETWASASVRKKLNILFAFFEHLPNRSKGDFPIIGIHLWRPDSRTNDLLQADWERIQRKVRHGRAHELSESDGRIMGPCTKGLNAGSMRPQPFSDEPAKTRAFALKPSFTSEIFKQITTHPYRFTLDVEEPNRFEDQLIARFRPFVGRRVGDVADELGIHRSSAKSYAAAVARQLFGARSFKAEIRQFAEMGLTPRVTRVSDELMPYEAVSFPAFRYRELIQETWEDSDLLGRVEYMLFLPVHGRTKSTPQVECTFGLPRFWRPSAADLELIRREWETYRLEIERGDAASVTPASETVAIHVRPHSRNARDTDDAPGAGQVIKKSFWLNRSFVAQILRGER